MMQGTSIVLCASIFIKNNLSLVGFLVDFTPIEFAVLVRLNVAKLTFSPCSFVLVIC
jgi:hypothetical protein